MNRSELNALTRAKLIEFGRKKKIAVTTSMSKAELVTAVVKGMKQLEKKKSVSPKSKTVSKKVTKKASAKKKTTKKKAAVKKKPTVKPKSKVKTKAGLRTAAKKKKSAVKVVLPSASRANKKTSKKNHAALAVNRKVSAASSQWVHSQNVEEDLAAKFILGQPEISDEAGHEIPVDLPAGYGDHVLALMPRDPYWAYCYWELQTPEVEASRSQLNRGWDELRWVLRAHVRTDKVERYFDTDIDVLKSNEYLHLAAPGATCRVQLGLLDREGYFAVVVESNSITLPADAPSENLDEQWMLTDEELRHHYAGTGAGSNPAREGSRAAGVSGEHHVRGSVHLQSAPRKK